MSNKLRLRYVDVVDFRQSELTNFDAFRAKNRELCASFKADDVVLFMNSARTQLVFVYGFRRIKLATELDILPSRRLRLRNGAWSPKLLVEYAKLAGIELQGLKSFEERYEAHRTEVREHLRELRQAA